MRLLASRTPQRSPLVSPPSIIPNGRPAPALRPRSPTMLDEATLLTALRGERDLDDVCRAAGITPAEFAEARDAYLHRRLPPTDARLTAAVRGPVEILRDRSGIPHIYASTTAELYFGLGFAT